MDVVLCSFSILPDFISEKFRQTSYTENKEVTDFRYMGINFVIISDKKRVIVSISIAKRRELSVIRQKDELEFTATNISRSICTKSIVVIDLQRDDEDIDQSFIDPVLKKWM